jgi:3-methyl-2-oxobutanoate hydroxymethyltransferase
MNILQLANFKQDQRKFSMLTCYDFWSAQIINQSPIDIILVGDSLAMVMHGNSNTLPATIDIMQLHTKAVVMGAPDKFIVADMPFASYASIDSAIENASSLLRLGAKAIKLEGALGNEKIIERMVESGIPVMGHIGLTPQHINALGGFKIQGRSEQKAQLLTEQAKILEKCGCFAIVLECMPSFLAKNITNTLKIPTIGIGAGPSTDGQVLVLHDLLGVSGQQPKFVKSYLKGKQLISYALKQFHDDVCRQEYPATIHCYEE